MPTGELFVLAGDLEAHAAGAAAVEAAQFERGTSVWSRVGRENHRGSFAAPWNHLQESNTAQKTNLKSTWMKKNIYLLVFAPPCESGLPSAASTCERRGLAQRAVLVVDVRGAVAGGERRGGGEHQLLFDEAGFGVVLRQLLQPLLQSTPEQVQALGGAAQTALGLQDRAVTERGTDRTTL